MSNASDGGDKRIGMTRLWRGCVASSGPMPKAVSGEVRRKEISWMLDACRNASIAVGRRAKGPYPRPLSYISGSFLTIIISP